MVLLALLGDHPRCLTWYTDEVHAIAESISLPTLKKLCYSAFLDVNWQTARLMELMDTRFGKDETVKDFVHRFSQLMPFLTQKRLFLEGRYIVMSLGG